MWAKLQRVTKKFVTSNLHELWQDAKGRAPEPLDPDLDPTNSPDLDREHHELFVEIVHGAFPA
eukprot:6188119-Pyramimonas_sp.AAC.1